ncbi:fungal-specific transcription factor domain-containing protein [Podospora didyma]|uniref:Fungal-specific transcription factor domain-containing protein n=1 Tax=Podospora didyma TaxID=330526 RepID=A0AAE0NPP1_9PEZI|nr:fungal-specific transcription factor domain-containing protein [Podospora didyma]
MYVCACLRDGRAQSVCLFFSPSLLLSRFSSPPISILTGDSLFQDSECRSALHGSARNRCFPYCDVQIRTMTSSSSLLGKRRSPSEGAGDTSDGESASTPAHSSHQSRKQQVRHRASVACASCRERRIRCVVPEGASECTQCKRSGAECIIKNDDERRRPISKAYMSSLSSRISLLEGMLKERGVSPPPTVHPPKTRHEAQEIQQQQNNAVREASQQFESLPTSSPEREASAPLPSGEEEHLLKQSIRPEGLLASMPGPIDPMLSQNFESIKDGNARRLLCAEGNLVFDHTLGRHRFFGSTANSHVYAESSCPLDSRGLSEQARRADRVVRALPNLTRDYLMSCFWSSFNSALQVVDRAAFEAEQDSPSPKFYSSFLHVTMLAAGYRYADREREDVKRITMRNWESTFHREAKYMMDIELERPGAIPSVQALLILADLECGVGRDSTGWMYLGMANRLAFDIGLHVGCNLGGISHTEKRIRRQVMAACVLLDRQWAVLLGRPTSIKNQDISMDLTSTGFSPLSPDISEMPFLDPGMAPSIAIEAAIHQQLFALMELAGKIADAQNTTHSAAAMSALSGSKEAAYLHVITLDRHLQNWYRRLPEPLTWKPGNIKSAPFSFFMLHQQYHVCTILLHRPWAKYGPTTLGSLGAFPNVTASTQLKDEATRLHAGFSHGLGRPQLTGDDNRASLSRSMCTQHAVRVSRIFWQHRQRFNGRTICLSGIQHAGTAALALMAALAHQSAQLDHQSNLRYLQVLSTAIYDMSHTYSPAARMYHLLKNMLVDIRKDMATSNSFDAGALLNRYHHQNTLAAAAISNNNNNSMIFDTSRFSPSMETLYSLPAARSLQKPDADNGQVLKKRRRLSSHHASGLARPMPSILSVGNSPDQLPPRSSHSLKEFNSNVSVKRDRRVSEVATHGVDLDFFHASFIDFINGNIDKTMGAGGDAGNNETSDLSIEGSTPPPAVTIDTMEGILSHNDHSDQQPQTGHSESPTADLTIEEWLAEPPALTPTSSSSHAGNSKHSPDSSVRSAEDFAGMLMGDDAHHEHTDLDGSHTVGSFGAFLNGSDGATPPGGDDEGVSSLEWMMIKADPLGAAEAGGTDGMTLNDLMQSVQKAAGTRDKPAVRNRELDFLSL